MYPKKTTASSTVAKQRYNHLTNYPLKHCYLNYFIDLPLIYWFAILTTLLLFLLLSTTSNHQLLNLVILF
jgi:hypothetical protein